MKATLRKVRIFIVVQYALMLEYRGEIFFWAVATILPLIMMGPWMVAGATGRFALGQSEFARYFIAAFLVRQFQLVWVIYEFEFYVVSGRLSPLLLHPIDPIWRWVSAHIGETLTRAPFIVMIVAFAIWLFPQSLETPSGATWLPEPGAVALAALACASAFTLRFLLQYALAMGAFWIERVSAFDRLVFLPYLFISGLIAPLEVFPPLVREISLWTPFPYLIWYPAGVLTGGQVPPASQAFAVIGLWALALHLIGRTLWRRGLRHYSAMGA